QLAVGVYGGRHGRAPVGFAGDVQMHVRRLTARGPDLGLDLLALVVEDVSEHHGRALADEHPPFNRSLSPGAAADQRDFAVQSSHRDLLYCGLVRNQSLYAAISVSSDCSGRLLTYSARAWSVAGSLDA